MSRPGILNVMYPASAASDFDMDYYLKTHMPLVQENWGPQGLLEWTVVVLPPESGYHVQAILKWESAAHFENARAETVDTVMGDVKNFTSATPQKWLGNTVGSSA